MYKLILVLLIALIFEAIGVVWLSHGLKQIGEVREITAPEIARVVKRGATNSWLLLGVLFETVFFVTLLYLLKNWDVSLVWPLTSLGFVITTCAAKFLRHEEINTWRWSGVALIVMGAMLVGYSERVKKAAPQAVETSGAGVSRE